MGPSAPAHIVAQLTDPETRRVLSSIVHESLPETRLAFCDSVHWLMTLVMEQQPQAVVVQPRDATGMGVAGVASALAHLDDPPTVIMALSLTLAEVGEVCAALDSGLCVVMVPRWAGRSSEFGMKIRTALLAPPDQGAERAMLMRITSQVAPSLRLFFAACALTPPHEHTVSRAVSNAGAAVRTIEQRLSRLGYPSAQTIVGWHRVLHAAWRLDVRGLSIKQAIGSGDTSLGSPRALANLVRRYAGLTLTELRQPGRFAALLRRFSALIEPSAQPRVP